MGQTPVSAMTVATVDSAVGSQNNSGAPVVAGERKVVVVNTAKAPIADLDEAVASAQGGGKASAQGGGKRVFHSGVGIEVSARPRVLCGIRAKDLSSQARGDINYRCVGAVNIGNSEIANLQEVVAEPHAVGSHLALEGVQLAKTAACAGAAHAPGE